MLEHLGKKVACAVRTKNETNRKCANKIMLTEGLGIYNGKQQLINVQE